jgi:uncharacterized protein YfaS (alpha-2-macroglobulin family)
VQTTLTNPRGKIIGKFSFEATKAKLVNFPFPEDAEQPAGEYTVGFAVDGQTLLEKIILKHYSNRWQRFITLTTRGVR